MEYPASDSTKFRCACLNRGWPGAPNLASKCCLRLVPRGALLLMAWMDGASVTASMNADVVLCAMTSKGRIQSGSPDSR